MGVKLGIWGKKTLVLTWLQWIKLKAYNVAKKTAIGWYNFVDATGFPRFCNYVKGIIKYAKDN